MSELPDESEFIADRGADYGTCVCLCVRVCVCVCAPVFVCIRKRRMG